MAAINYDHKSVEKKWQAVWEKSEDYKTADQVKGKDNLYLLFEFPYPSGNLHVGHWYAYAPTDILARYYRAKGKNVLYPIGFDSFGLPAENAAIKRGLDPQEWTNQNIDYMIDQVKNIGASVDWSRMIKTSDPEYYKWTQYIFTKFLEKGLAYKAKQEVNWCPKCQTVLANEQVVQGKCDRCQAPVEKKTMEQWMLRITDYSEQLLNDLDNVDWPEEIKTSQRNWIGKSEGAEFVFKTSEDFDIKVFTTRPDTFFGVTYLVVAPENEILTGLRENITNYSEVEKYIKKAQSKTDVDRVSAKEKTGVKLEGVTATHPATGEELPIFVADYVLSGYGTGAIMAVPAHDERDNEFARKYNQEIKIVVAWESGTKRENEERRDGGVAVIFDPNTQKYAFGKTSEGLLDLFGGGVDEGESIIEGITREVEEESGLHDFSEITIIDDALVHYYNFKKKVARVARATCGLFVLDSHSVGSISQEVHEDYELLWLDPEEAISYWEDNNDNDDYTHWIKLLKRGVNNLIYKGLDKTNNNYKDVGLVHQGCGVLINSDVFDGLTSEEAGQKITEKYGEKATTYRLRDWSVGRQRYWGCPIPVVYDPEGKPHPVPEEHLPWLLPRDVDHTPDGTAPLARSAELKKRVEDIFGIGWTPEVETLDTFVDSSWYFIRYLDPNNDSEVASSESQKSWLPVDFYSGGAEHTTMHLLYSRFFYKAMRDVGIVSGDEPYQKRMNRSLIMGPDGQKMSKSKGNIIDPDEQVKLVGSDTLRIYLSFVGPYNEVGTYPWDPGGVVGVRRFLERVWGLQEFLSGDEKDKVEVSLHKTIKKVGVEIENVKLNTGVSAMMEFVNLVEKEKSITKSQYETFLQVLAPYAPHMTEELWEKLENKESIHLQPWPEYKEELLETDTVLIPVQINGKKRGEVQVAKDSTEEDVMVAIKADSTLDSRLSEVVIKKTIYVPGRIFNIVVDTNN